MELQFRKTVVPCLESVLHEVQNTEQTLEIKLPDALPDIGHIVAAWGQPILRSKEWRSDSIYLSGGVMVWVLYAPEDGSGERTIDGWMPFQLKWDLPPDTREGSIRIHALLRNVDARSVSARKIMARAGVGALAEAFSPMEAEAYAPDAGDGEVELLRSTYPLRLPREAGEKTFLIDEELPLPEPAPEQLLCFRMEPRLLDKKVLGAKAVFRGNGNLHLLYRDREGQLHSRDFELPFSQFAELDREHGSDALMDLVTQVTALELEPMEDRLRLKGGLVAQYLISDKELLELIEDAYAPGREVKLDTRLLELPTHLESRRETLYPELTIPGGGGEVEDVQFLPDFPVQRRTEAGVDMELPGMFQVLYRGEDGTLRGSNARWTGRHSVTAHENTDISALPMTGETQAAAGGGQITAKAELPLDITATARQAIPMVTGVEVGQSAAADPARPSLILKRAGTARLWDIAKANNTTMEAIRKANDLQQDPAPNQMLLIPVP
ncbi:MAG: LysM peptidoglycan-binding domain-containing protein [Eubacteriales bacterium]|nr:LysM peptidoglycan-binding domain-containing protein [Eubacteriales bacterium]